MCDQIQGLQYLKAKRKEKACATGIETSCLCDSKTSYLFQFDLYTATKTDHDVHRLGEGVVLTLTEKIKKLYCQISIDFFSLPQIQFKLPHSRIFSTDAVWINIKSLPDGE